MMEHQHGETQLITITSRSTCGIKTVVLLTSNHTARISPSSNSKDSQYSSNLIGSLQDLEVTETSTLGMDLEKPLLWVHQDGVALQLQLVLR